MAEVIADLLQRQALAQQVRGAGVTQDVRALMRQRHTQSTQTLSDDGPKGTTGQRTERGTESQEDLAMAAGRSHFLEVAEHRIADGPRQRVGLRPARLGPAHAEQLTLP